MNLLNTDTNVLERIEQSLGIKKALSLYNLMLYIFLFRIY